MFDPQCYNSLQELAGCRWQPPTPTDSTPSPNTPPAAPTRDQIEAVVRSLASRLDLPEPTPLVGPDPSVNEWNRSFVGLPIWLWTAGEPTLHSTVTGYGITITMNAQRGTTTFTMGDGNKVTCTRMTPYTKATKPGAASPTCGHTYTWPSLPDGNYTITATSHWTITWTALGYNGTIPLTRTAQRDLPVGELHSLNTKR